MKKICLVITMMLCVATLLSCFVACRDESEKPGFQNSYGLAEGEKVIDGAVYTYSKGGAKLKSVPQDAEGEFVIPAYLTVEDEYYMLNGIEKDAFAYSPDITSVVVPSGILYFDESPVFASEDIVIKCKAQPNALLGETFGDTGLETVWGFDNVKDEEKFDYVIEGGKAYITAYKGESKNVVIPPQLGGCDVEFFGYTFFANEEIESVIMADTVKYIAPYAFFYTLSMREVKFSSNLKILEDFTFLSSGIESVTLSKGIEIIKTAAFASCQNLKKAVLPDSANDFGNYIFSDCVQLSSVKLPSGIKKIPYGIFSSCIALESVDLPDTVEYIDEEAFNFCGIKEFVIPSKVYCMGRNAFANCFNLNSVTFENTASWRVANSASSSGGITVYAFDIAEKEKAADMLKEQYKDYFWLRG